MSKVTSAENLVSFNFSNCLNYVFFEYYWLMNYFCFHILDNRINNIVKIDLYYKVSDSDQHIHDSKIICNKIIHSPIIPFNLPQRRLIQWSIDLWLNKKHMNVLLNIRLDANNSILKEVDFQYKRKFIFSVANDVFGIFEKFLEYTNIIFYC